MSERALFITIFLLVAAAVVVPYTVLSPIERLAGAFLFWVIFAFAVIVLIVRATASWRDWR